MKLIILFSVSIVMMTSLFAEQKNDVLEDENARLNYSVGFQVGSDFKQQEFELRPDAVVKGIEDALSGSGSLMSKQEMQKTMADMGRQVADLKNKKRQQIALYQDENRDFLSRNSSKKGVTTTASGLQYRVIEEGHGETPKITDRVLVHYRGKLINGTEFDSSHKRKKPSSFKVNQVIKGWSEALQMMPHGSHWQLFIPAELAYGEQGAGSRIPPNSALIFDVELIAIQQ